MTKDEQRVTEMAEDVCKRINPSSVSPLNSQKDYVTMTPEELLAFEQECIKRRDAEWLVDIKECRQFALGIEKMLLEEGHVSIDANERLGHILQSIKQGVERKGLEVLALHEALKKAQVFMKHYGYEHASVDEALTNSEESAKRIKAEVEADALSAYVNGYGAGKQAGRDELQKEMSEQEPVAFYVMWHNGEVVASKLTIEIGEHYTPAIPRPQPPRSE